MTTPPAVGPGIFAVQPGDHVLERQQWLARPRDEIFAFFSDASNLARITPPWMGFQIRTPPPITMRSGALIDYTVRMAGLPLRWRTLIERWDPPHQFVDIQLEGPYAKWVHTHRFEAVGDGTLLTDRVVYRVPLGPLGRLAHGLYVRSTLTAIFDYRYRRVRELLLDGVTAPVGV